MKKIILRETERANEISPLLYGIFFEDINYAGDGGLYGELVANRSFAFYDRDGKADFHALGWGTANGADLSVKKTDADTPFGAYTAKLSGKTNGALYNEGFCGEGFAAEAGQEFLFTCFVRSKKPVRLRAVLRACPASDEALHEMQRKQESAPYKKEIGSAAFVSDSPEWKKVERSIVCNGHASHAVLAIELLEDAEAEFTYVSLFPKDTFGGRKNGMRRDLAELLKGLSPKFMRFPGGCIVEGRSFSNMYNWKETIGDPWERRTNWNRWQMEEYQQEGRHSLDYFQSYGIGFFEYFLLCEDIGATPVPVINCGMTCQWHEGLLVPMEELSSYVQDALDLVEFANGGADTKWGAVRTRLGHEAPFDLKYIGIGNEQWGAEYFVRYEAFAQAFQKQHPEIRLITCAGWDSGGADFDFAYAWMREHAKEAYAADEHFYKSPEWFLENVHRYDAYDRALPKVVAGEYAAHTSDVIPKRRNNLYAALCEAAFLTGVEKNADHVVMSCYAPLFARDHHQQWQPDLIWFDREACYGSPSYYVQKLFSGHTGTAALAIEEDLLKELEGEGVYVSASLDEAKGVAYVKLVNLSGEEKEFAIDMDGTKEAKGFFIEGNPEDENSFAEPERISIEERRVELSAVRLGAAGVCALDILL